MVLTRRPPDRYVYGVLRLLPLFGVWLIVVVMVQLGSRVLKGFADYVFVLATAAAVAGFGVPVPYALLAAGAIGVWWHRPRRRDDGDAK